MVFCCPSVGLAVWANDSVVAIEIISPAVAIAPRKTFRIEPMARPISTSRRVSPTSSPIVSGITGSSGLTAGAMTRAINSANASRAVAGTGVPSPGMVMIIEAMRAKTRAPANSCWAVA